MDITLRLLHLDSPYKKVQVLKIGEPIMNDNKREINHKSLVYHEHLPLTQRPCPKRLKRNNVIARRMRFVLRIEQVWYPFVSRSKPKTSLIERERISSAIFHFLFLVVYLLLLNQPLPPTPLRVVAQSGQTWSSIIFAG